MSSKTTDTNERRAYAQAIEADLTVIYNSAGKKEAEYADNLDTKFKEKDIYLQVLHGLRNAAVYMAGDFNDIAKGIDAMLKKEIPEIKILKWLVETTGVASDNDVLETVDNASKTGIVLDENGGIMLGDPVVEGPLYMLLRSANALSKNGGLK